MAIEHWVTLVPNTKALKKGIEEFKAANKDVTVEVKTDPAQARKAGSDAGKAIDKGVQEATKGTVNDFGKAFDRLGKEDLIKIDPAQARKSGQKAGEGAAQGVEDGVKKAGLASRLSTSMKGALDQATKTAATGFSKNLQGDVLRHGFFGGFAKAGKDAAEEFGKSLRLGVGTTVSKFAPEVSDRLGKTVTDRLKQLGKKVDGKGALGNFGGAVLDGAASPLGRKVTSELRSRGTRLGEVIAGRKLQEDGPDDGRQGRRGKQQQSRRGQQQQQSKRGQQQGRGQKRPSAAAFMDQASAVGDSIGELDSALERTKNLLGGEDSWAAPGIQKLQGALGATAPAMAALGVASETSSIATAAMSAASKTATGIQWLFNAALTANPIGIVVAAIAALVAGLVLFFTKTELGRKIWETTWGFIKTSISTVWDVTKATFDKVMGFISGLPDRIKNIGRFMWDGLKLGLATVLNSIAGLWNRFADTFSFTVPDWVPVVGGKGWTLPHMPTFVGGGQLSGPGSGTSDSIVLRASNGEFITNAKSTAKNLPLLMAINSGALDRFENGGLVGAGVSPLNQYAQSMVGRKYSMETRDDCSGTMSELANVATGRPPRSSLMTTVNEGSWLQSRGFILGRGGPGTFRIGWYDHGGGANGHTAGTLPDGTNVESSGSTGMFTMGAAARGADNPMFDKQAFLPMSPQGQTVGGDGASLGGVGGSSGGGGYGGSGSGGGGGSTGGARRIGGAGGGSDPAKGIFDQLKSIGEGGVKETFLPQGFSDPMSWPNVQSGMALLKVFGGMLGKPPGQGMGDQGLIGDTRNLAPGELNPAITAGGSASLLGGAEGMMTQLTQGAVARPAGGEGGNGGVDMSTNIYGNVDGDISKTMGQKYSRDLAQSRPLQTSGAGVNSK